MYNTCQHYIIHTVTLLHVSALKQQYSGSNDTFCEQGQHSTCEGKVSP